MSSDLPKVSIVLPVYNGSKYVRESIDSCLKQTHANIELIIVDDGSTDESAEIISSYRDARIRCVRHESNRGLPAALNTGFEHATGEYLTWTSHDNYYAAEAIQRMLSVLRSKPCEFVYCDFYRFSDEDPAKLSRVRLPEVLALEEHNGVGACFLYSRSVRYIVGDYDPDTELAEDYDYWIRVSREFSMCHVDEPLYFFRAHGESLSSRFSTQHEIQTVSVLVRVKDGIIDVERASRQFCDLIVEKMASSPRPLTPVLFAGLKRVRESSYRFLVRMRFSNEINRILTDYRMGRIGFGQAKSSLKDIMNSRWM